MALTTYDLFISQCASGIKRNQPIGDEAQANTTATFLARNIATMTRRGYTKPLPSPLPSGVTAYICSRISVTGSSPGIALIVAKLIDLGSIDISTPTFTDGSAMPTKTELNASNVTASPVLCEVTTALNATPGSLQITYVDQDGNTAEATTAQVMTASSVVKSAAYIDLNGTDWGVQDITAATRTGGTTPTGVVQFWGLLPITICPLAPNTDGVTWIDNLIGTAFNPTRLGAGDVIGAFQSGSALSRVYGNLFFVGDN